MSLENQVVEMLQKHNIPIDKKNISACHTIPNKTKPSERPIVIRFTNRKDKIKVLQNSWRLSRSTDLNNPNKKTEHTNIYINEHLTTKYSTIAKRARDLRRRAVIEKTWVKNCKVFIKYKLANGDFKVMLIKNLDELNAFMD